jgi:cytochrome o ubiquinol oxidase subunit II
MSKRTKAALIILFFAGLLGLAIYYVHSHNVPILNPKGTIAAQEKHLMVITLLLSTLVVVPVFAMAIFIVWKYRVGNTKTKKRYEPDWANNRFLETLWWGIPCAIIVVLAIITWNSAHALDPFKPIDTSKKPITIQVVALNWKWLFIYPSENVATVNYIKIPINTPVSFHITSDAPMNSFWVPQLAGQIYAMSGMDTQLHLEASQVGTYNGSSANISGDGFAGMKFQVQAVSAGDYSKWVNSIKQSSDKFLSTSNYEQLARPSENNPHSDYSGVSSDLYDTVINKYMTGHAAGGSGGMQH